MKRIALLVAIAVIAALAVALMPRPLAAVTTVAAVLVAGWSARRATPPMPASPPPSTVAASRPRAIALPEHWLEGFPCGVFLLDRESNVVAVNQAALTLCHRRRAEVEGVSLIRAVRDHNIAQVAREAAGVPREIDIRDGQVVRVTATRLAEPIAGARYVLALEDLTALRHAQRARSDLVANASHELRTPVTAALALAETLERGVPDDARRLDFHQRLTNEVTRLSDIIEGLLNLSRLESRNDEFTIEALSPAELLQTSARRIEPLLEAGRSLTLIDGCSATAIGDRERVLEVLANLLDNALRVSPPNGTVTLGAFEGEDEVRFEVRDQGPGIISRDRARVFERFYTGDRSRTDLNNGSAARNSGLGLAIARHIVSRLGGRIWVADRSPGATLCFTLPLDPANAATAGVAATTEGETGESGARAPDRLGSAS